MLCCRLNTGEARDRAVVCGCAIRFARADRGARPPRCKNTDDERHEDFFFWVHIARRAISPPPPRPPGAVAESLSHPEVWADIVSPAQVMCGDTHINVAIDVAIRELFAEAPPRAAGEGGRHFFILRWVHGVLRTLPA